jgi:TonB-linked SusC/RagA family outer membrane protein
MKKKKFFCKWLNKLFLQIILFCLVSTSLFAQQVKIQGTVTVKDSGEPLPFVNVYIKGTTTGTVTDGTGFYSMDAPMPGAIMVFSFVGYIESEVTYSGQDRVDVILEPEITSMDEVVVIGYGTMKKRDLSGSVSVVSSDQIIKTHASSFDNALQGKAAGVMVVGTSGRPGSEPTVKIRGIGSINRESEPLYVIDGLPVTGGINHLNPGDIESVNILKDASATAIYGARGANGVIIINTKRGAKGKPVINFSTYASLSVIPRLYDIMNADEYVAFTDSAYKYFNADPANDYKPFPAAYSDSARASHGWTNTDWQREISRPAWGQNYDMRISGGGENSNYMVSGNFYRDNGILIGTSMKRYTLKANSDFVLGKRIQMGESFNFSNIAVDAQSHYTNGNPWQVATITSPLMAVYDSTAKGGYAGPTPEVTPVNERTNPVAEQMLNENTNSTNRFLLSIYAEIDIWQGLKFKTVFGYDMSFYQSEQWNPVYELGTIGGRSRSTSVLNVEKSFSTKYVWDKQLIFDHVFGKHNISAIFVHSNEDGRGASLQGKGENFDFENLRVLAMADPSTYTANGYKGRETMESYLGRIVYNYSNKYYLTASIRNDGSSKFGPKHKHGTFPSFSVAWKFNEDFLQQFEFINMAKIRIGYGVTGNENIGSFQYESYIEPKVEFVTAMGDPARTVFGRGPLYNFGNASIQWEEARMTNIGIDFTGFNNRLEFSAEYYYKNQQKMLATIPISSIHGRLEGFEPWSNVANMVNRGIELNTVFKKMEGELTYTLNGNFSTIKNKVLDLPVGRNIIESHSITMPDHTISSFYGHVAQGIFQSEEEVAQHAFQNEGTRPGDIKFKDLNKDGRIDDLDRTIIGKPVPDFYWGLTFDGYYRGFDLQIFLYSVMNVDIYDQFRANTGLATDPDSKDNNKLKEVMNFWSPYNKTNDQVRANFNDPNDNNRVSSFFVKNASFLRIKNLQLSYTLPDKIINMVGIKEFRVYLSFTNLYTLTKYKGYDPEIGSRSNLNFGIDSGTYPLPRTFMAGIQIEI